ncbi:MAG TPA: hypothetical protein VL361_28950 [Candidatus Limnocylindrales bacterium]|jgi:hypothetical protein|nr:hypothetical protein [Candidatus Limnocylindrales bacterium]
MAGIPELKSLAARKQALVAQSEVYRQTLAIELENLKLYRAGLERKFRLLRALKPLLFIAPLAGSFLGLRSRLKGEPKKPVRGWQKWWGAAMLGLRLYRKAGPMVAHLVARRNNRSRHHRRFGEITP